MIVYAGEDAELGNTPPLLGVGVQTCPATLEIIMEVFFRKLGINLSQDHSWAYIQRMPTQTTRTFAQLYS